MINNEVPKVCNWIDGKEENPQGDSWIEKNNPHDGKLLCYVADSTANDTKKAITSAYAAFTEWSEYTPVHRGQILGKIVDLMKVKTAELANCIAVETGKPPQDASGETSGAILQGEYFASEGMRLYSRSLTSGTKNKYSHTVRQPRGVAGLIIPANTPIANIAWKAFPALICGNSVVMKAAEDSPQIALLFAKITKEAGLPDGVFNVVQGLGNPAGSTLVTDHRVSIISFTGSTKVGKWIAEECGKRLARVSLELGGKNPFVVCNDADMDQAVNWASLSAFSNAGQRCASGSRLIVFKSIYDEFVNRIVAKAKSLKLGVTSESDLGPVISKKQQQNILTAIQKAELDGGKILCGGRAPADPSLSGGYYIEPTVIVGLSKEAELYRKEIFGPVTIVIPAKDIVEALEIANSSEYGLTASIHTKDVDRAMWFAQKVKAGVANINMGTYGSEPHMPFGGFGLSGNGSREPGVEALDVYSELKNISFLVRADKV